MKKNEYFDFLDELRKSGLVNMFESPRVLRDTFPKMTKNESYKIFNEWAVNFKK